MSENKKLKIDYYKIKWWIFIFTIFFVFINSFTVFILNMIQGKLHTVIEEIIEEVLQEIRTNNNTMGNYPDGYIHNVLDEDDEVEIE